MTNSSWVNYAKRNVGIIIAGIALQLLLGNFNNTFLRYPIGAILAIAYVYSLYVIQTMSEQKPWIRSLYDYKASITSMSFLLFLLILMGLLRQSNEHSLSVFPKLGINHMTSSWPFCLALFHFTSILGLQVMEELSHFSQRRIMPTLIHLCVFLIFAVSIFNCGDKEKVIVRTQLNEATHHGVSDGHKSTLPFSIKLKKFTLEEYPAKLYLIDEEGKLSKETITMDHNQQVATLDDWQIAIDKYIPQGLPDSLNTYQEIKHVGAVPIAFVRAKHNKTLVKTEGWVTCGSFIVPKRSLALDSSQELLMATPMAKRYCSEIEIEDLHSGEVTTHSVEVNHPAHIASWRIYQLGYDTELGSWSQTSTLECVKDPGYFFIHIALWMILTLSILMFFNRTSKNKL